MILSRVLIAACLIGVCIVAAGCTGSSARPVAIPLSQVPSSADNSPVDRVEVIHFHGNQQCTSCIAVGELAEETVKEYFPRDLASGRVSFRHINYDDPANRDIVASYGITGSSLWITSFDASGEHRLQDMDVWFLDDRERDKEFLAETISKQLREAPS